MNINEANKRLPYGLDVERLRQTGMSDEEIARLMQQGSGNNTGNRKPAQKPAVKPTITAERINNSSYDLPMTANKSEVSKAGFPWLMVLLIGGAILYFQKKGF